MGPTPTLYRHPWIMETSHSWDHDPIKGQVCEIYFQYPEDPDYGFSVRCYAFAPYELRQVKYVPKIETRGDMFQYVDIDKMTHHIDTLLYRRGVSMEKVGEIYELAITPADITDSADLAPF